MWRNKVILAMVLSAPLWAWDSRTEGGFQFGIPMHAQYTSEAARQLDREDGIREPRSFSDRIRTGSLTELHELPTKANDRRDGQALGLDLEVLRVRHRGTNEGCDDIQGWWNDSLAAYRAGRKDQAYFLLGITLHMIQDMGVPAHANVVIHQGDAGQFDNFEFNSAVQASFLGPGTQVRIPQNRVNRNDPLYGDPSRYYAFSRDWTRADAPDYNDRDSFPKFRVWPWWKEPHQELMFNRQVRSYVVTYWAMKAAARAFQGTPNPN